MESIKQACSGDDSVTAIEGCGTEGEMIGVYRLLQKLGEGGFGEVWMAEQRQPVKRRVALKVIKLGMDTRQVVARFEAERQALAMMDHPNIARVFDAGSTDSGRPYFVMELVRGVSITEYCETHRTDVAERLSLFVEICSAIQHAHQKGIIHRDIKPSNILVAVQDGKPVPKVIDFGIAKATQQQLTDKTVVTQMQQFVGTPAYMSPEQAEMTSLDIDTRTDIYSLGVLLYQLLTGQTPFDQRELLSAGWEQMRRIIREKEPPRPSTRLSQQIAAADAQSLLQTRTLVQRLRGDLDWIVMKCLEKDRTRRYETANGLALDIQRHLRNEAVLARPPTASYRLKKIIRRNRMAFAATLAFAVLLVGTALFSTASYLRERVARSEAERQRLLADRARMTADSQKREAEQEKEKARRNLYLARMNLLQSDWEHNDFSRFRATLEQTKDFPERSFEWDYWHHQGHLEVAALNISNAVRSLSFSPDGKLLAASGGNPAVWCWEVASGRLRWRGGPGTDNVVSKFSPDGAALAVAQLDGAITLLDAKNGARLKGVPPASENKRSPLSPELAWSSDGRLLAATGFRSVRVFRGNDLTLERSLPDNDVVRGLAFSPNGERLAACDTAGNIRILNATFNPVAQFHRNTCLNKILFTADGEKVIVSGNDSKAVVIEINSGRVLRTFDRQPGIIRAMNLTSDGRSLLTGSEDNSAILWDLATGEAINEFKGHTRYVWGSAISPDDQLVATGDSTGEIKIWRARVTPAITLENGPDGSDFAMFAPNLDRAVAASERTGTALWETTFGKRLISLRDESRALHARDGGGFSADGLKLLLTGGPDLTADLLELFPEASKPLWHIDRPCTAGTLSRDGQRIVIGTGGGAVEILDAKTRRVEQSVSLQTNAILSVTLSADETYVAASDVMGGLVVWRRGTAAKVLTFGLGTGEPPRRVSFMHDSRRLVAWAGNEVQIWNCQSGQRELVFPTPDTWALAISPDNRRIATSGTWGNPTVRLWDASTGEETLRLRTLTEIIVQLAFSPDGKRLGAITHQSNVQFWNAE